MTSPVYWHPSIYQFLVKLLYGKHFEARYKAISDIIPNGSSVVEVCAGIGYLYSNFLKSKEINYQGYDINPSFIRHAKKNSVPFGYCDVLRDSIARADYVLIHASLYQFIPKEHEVLKKLLDAANHVLIVSEPVRNLSQSDNWIISMIARFSANPGTGHPVKRFNEETLVSCFSRYPEFKNLIKIDGGRECIGLFIK